ncbi:carboxy-S-adenosyl-L-methionine synthase CmoA [Mariprofundus erugo]|uniref:Carboxy-S-adenosyl-L-methionine synthase n=1 Tax=Mariprofundus erugo TaxID=2528639 RepID=A0A5R9GPQ5_9PROT|nr:carboxy-S-adenosyl-L-methionine synthase CmoA [Mariprofundus erugo]TLS67950.1 carboxy-S-adenosyl-L-methionine synthase CmoA [Mariprofundus erugo]TLS76714.1 carboxy-S-adenosyl-L-methionine synthase CmoA [Mariprofundus erugo]
MQRDAIYIDEIHSSGFTFDDRVASVFSDMINRSVPGYAQTLQMVELLSHQYAQNGSNLYDLGCSLGAATLALRRGSRERQCRVIGIDNSAAMIDRCRQILGHEDIELHCQDILATPIENASVVVLNFVLQFIAIEQRQQLLQAICTGLRPGGILILSEKISFPDPRENRLQIELHEAFKRAHGYSELEISRKRTALEDVLIPEPLSTHHQRLADAGFCSSHTWFQCFNFSSMIAIKSV